MKVRLYALMRAAFPALALVAGGSVFAQSVTAPDSAFQRFLSQTTGVGKQTITFGSGGQPIVGQGVPTITHASGPVEVSRSVPLRNPSGIPFNVQAKVAVPSSVLSRSLKRLALSLPVIGSGIALYQVAQELGFTITKDASGPLVIEKDDPEACTVAPCFLYTHGSSGPPAGITTRTTHAAAASGWAAYTAANPSYDGWGMRYYQFEGVSGASSRFGAFRAGTNERLGTVYINPTVKSVPPTSGASPSTLDELADAIASESGWPTSSSVGVAYEQAISQQLGEPFTATPDVTGPATTTGPTTTTDTGTEIETQTVTHNHTYEGPTVSTATTTTTNYIDKETGEPSRPPRVVTEQPTVPGVEPFAMPCGIAGLPPCDVKVDEAGVPSADDIKIDQADESLDNWDDFVTNIASHLPEFPTINWDFSLPTGCGVIPLPAFDPYLPGIDICEYQPMFHEIMSVVWVLGGLFGAISLFMRSALSMN